MDKIKTRDFQHLMTPVSAFITFESEEGYQRALNMCDNGRRLSILGTVDPRIVEAPEPTNIIWENRPYSFFHRLTRLLISSIVIVFLLSISFSIIFVLKRQAKENNLKYQQGVCSELYDTYGDKYLIEYAVQDWYNYYGVQANKPASGSKAKISSILDCFCKKEYKKWGRKVAAQTYFD